MENELTPVEVFKRARDAGHCGAQCALAYMYQKGIGIEPDAKQAFKRWLKAAEQGFASAQYEVGVAYLEGVGVERNPAVALPWLREAARQLLYAESEYRLGCVYRDGLGVNLDPDRANRWFLLASKHGYPCTDTGEIKPEVVTPSLGPR